MSIPPPQQPTRWVWPVDASVYDQRHALTANEQATMDQLAIRRKKSPQLFDLNGLMKLPGAHPLYRLLQPILDVWQSAGVDRQELTDGVSFLLTEMQRRQISYWAWTPADWLALIGPTYPWFKQRYHKAKACRQFLTLFSYLLMDVTDLRVLSEAYLMPLAQRLFGPLVVEQAVTEVCGELARWGYTTHRTAGRLPSALCLLLLARRSPYLNELSTSLLVAVRRSSINVHLMDQLFPLSRVLVKLGYIEECLSKLVKKAQGDIYRDKLEGLSDSWRYWAQRWLSTSTL